MKNISMIITISLGCLVAGGCSLEDPGYSKDEFAQEMARAACGWVFSCCDNAEQSQFSTSSTEAGCRSQMRSGYSSLFLDADPQAWNPEDAFACVVALDDQVLQCPHSFDLSKYLEGCNVVAPSKNPGDFCESLWDCSTRFCKNGVCANPLPAGAKCSEEEPCQGDLRCLVGECQALEVDGAACTTGQECISGACGGGKCVVSSTYTCDGK